MSHSPMISKHIYDLCHSNLTVSSELAKNPTQPPGGIIHRLFPHSPIAHLSAQVGDHLKTKTLVHTSEDLERAYQCGNWGKTRPSDLFLKIYHDVLCTLNDDPTAGMVSPPLMGSSGVLPLASVSTCADNVRHLANLIARAEREVFLATNFWQASDTSKLITNALKELSNRAAGRGAKVIVKVIYDRGNIHQVFNNHLDVPPSEYTGTAVQLPHPDEIPNIDMQVVNYHHPILGTFHAKYLVVDRKFAVLCSNNIQDIDNLEMLCHFQGPIVDSVYDLALLTWHNALNPPLPTSNSPATGAPIQAFQPNANETLFNKNGSVKEWAELSANRHDGGKGRLAEHTINNPHYDPDIASEVARVQCVVSPSESETRREAITRHLNPKAHPDTKGTASDYEPGQEMTPYFPIPAHEPFPIAMACRRPYGSIDEGDAYTPQNEAWLSALRNATKEVFIQTPDMNSTKLIPAILDACRRGVVVTCYLCLGYNDAGELLPMQGGTNETISYQMHKVLEPEYKKNLQIYFYVAKDMTKPINAKFKKRSCHIKVMIVDSHIGIQGSGNQDTQSWFHSFEINVLIDSPVVCASWVEALRRNQNTHLYGKVGEDGVWRDAEGKEAEGSIGVDPGMFSWAKGIVGAVQRVRGAGGF